MRFLKNKIIWLTIYAIGVTFVFLYLLFPSVLVKEQLEATASAAGFVLRAESLHPSLPLGVKLQDLTLRLSSKPADVIFRGELLDLQVNPVSLFRKHKTIHFRGKAYRGIFDGRAGFLSPAQTNLPVEGKINFQDIDLARYSLTGFPLFKGMTGLLRGSVFYIIDEATGQKSAGTLSIYLSRGAYPLTEAFLGMNRIEFDRGEIQAQLKNGSVVLTKFEFYGTRMNCLLNGSISLSDRLDESRLNLTGVLEIVGKNKARMNIMVGGTLASPSVRYI